MGTRCIIARAGNVEGHFAGRYSHWDGYPTAKGPELWAIVQEKGVTAAVAYLIDEHPAGWSSLGKGECYCHPQNTSREDFQKRKPEPAQLFTQKHLKDSNAEWLYVFDEEHTTLAIRDLNHGEEVLVDLNGPQPDWNVIECGENFERCSHYAWYHKLLPRTSNLNTQTWLGRQALDFHDVIAVVVGGKRYVLTGSGGNSDYMARTSGQRFPRNTWVSSVKARNGKRMDIPVAKISGDEYTPLPGVTWIFPPTSVNSQETEVSA